ncbi:MAG: TonB family protein [Candidatus Zixiibacteriota bacterium]
MTSMLQTPYGAYEMKRVYQRNMLAGTGSMIVFTALVVFSVWLYNTLTYVAPVEVPPVVVHVFDLGPPPTLDVNTRPQVPIDKPAIPEVRAAIGIPVPVSDDELADEDERTLFTREQLKDIYAPAFGEGEGKGDGNFVIDADIIEEEIKPEDYVLYQKYPELIYEAIPEYPRLAEAAGFEAVVWVQVLINKQGSVSKAQVKSCSRPGLGFEEEAIRAAMKCTYRPAIQNDIPMACWIAYKIEFVQDN